MIEGEQTAGAVATGQDYASLLCCPDCRRPLTATNCELRCSPCDRQWAVIDGVPHFGGTDRRPHSLTYGQRLSIVEAASTDGWQAALHDRLRAINPIIYRQAIDEYRAQWRFVLPLSPSSRVLDLSCGWGAVSFNIAETCALVFAADACSAQARFIRLKGQQLGQENLVSLQLGLDQPLPFGDASFDAIVLIDALAWLPDAMAQRQLLRNLYALLPQGGALFLAEANRLSVGRFANPAMKRMAHTIGGYQRLLKSAGFAELRVYAPLPSHLEPFFMVPLQPLEPLSYFLREIVAGQDFGSAFRQRGQGTLYRLTRLAVRAVPPHLLAVLAKSLVPSVAIAAYK